MEKLTKIKIHCENAFWSERMQRVLHKEIKASWGFGLPIPWNTEREYLVLLLSPSGKWCFTWSTKEDFDACLAPLYTAKGLYDARPNKD